VRLFGVLLILSSLAVQSVVSHATAGNHTQDNEAKKFTVEAVGYQQTRDERRQALATASFDDLLNRKGAGSASKVRSRGDEQSTSGSAND
jgi:hypothetical protein